MAVSSANSCGFWKVLTSPAAAISCACHPAMFLPFQMILPALAGISPAMRLSSVVLPDPFGPKRPTISPFSMPKEMSATAVRPPKCLVSPAISSSMAAPHKLPQAAVDALRHHKNGEDEDRAVHDRADLGGKMDEMRQRRQHESARDRPGDDAAPAEQHHCNDAERLVDGEKSRLQRSEEIGVQAARNRCHHVARAEGGELVAKHVDAERVTEL